MQNFDKQQHWETIYQTKALNEVSWYQKYPRRRWIMLNS